MPRRFSRTAYRKGDVEEPTYQDDSFQGSGYSFFKGEHVSDFDRVRANSPIKS